MFVRVRDKATGVTRDVSEETLARWPEDYTVVPKVEPSSVERPAEPAPAKKTTTRRPAATKKPAPSKAKETPIRPAAETEEGGTP